MSKLYREAHQKLLDTKMKKAVSRKPIKNKQFVIPAQAGIHNNQLIKIDFCFRRNDQDYETQYFYNHSNRI